MGGRTIKITDTTRPYIEFTTQHLSSSYGIPVLLIHGLSFGAGAQPDHITPVLPAGTPADDVARIQAAGYRFTLEDQSL